MTSSHEPQVPRRRWRHRLPTSLRRHWKWPLALAVFAVVVITTIGSVTIRPLITGDERVIGSSVTENIVGSVDLFDDSVQHELSVRITDAEYSEMVDAFVKNGEKKWVTADVVIDGTVIKDVGVRLKGNSTLMSLRGGMRMPDGKDLPEGMAPPEGMMPPENMRAPEGMTPPQGMRVPDGAPDERPGTGMPMPGGPGSTTTLSADDPASLPLLLSFDKDVDGRAYQGMTQLSVRPGSPVLNEAMALSLTARTGQPTQRFAYTVYSVNDSTTATRLVVEHPDAGYADSLFESSGYLYKADASSRFEYIDDDQSSYSEQFTQVNSTDSGNLQPIIGFLKWLKNADDAEFDAHLSDWVDVDSFAEYLATQNLLSNMDDMSGPGQNYYLWYDLDSKKISVISWDLNLAMQGDATAGPHDSISMGPGGAGPGERPDRRRRQDSDRPDRMLGGNALKERFLASKKFTAVYDTAYWRLFDVVYAGDESVAVDVLDRFESTIPLSDGLTGTERSDAVESMRDWIAERVRALESARAD